ncbi:hypothetical protein [Dickeya chrysanthemi]|uniref:hypothetical protein n=1 Tax=Dickeya chrysanthemi TaxID=556 RepID=UPI001CF16416|nr:hypothetical protein [Dickeya chrysanthemi]MCA7009353.1 hypothetical protein [Dickeya chrysanthemi]
MENNYLSSSDITTFLDKYAKAKTEEEKEKLREELKQKDAAQQEQAQATGISVKDQKAELEKLKALMASPDCNAECQSLAAYSISQLEPVANDTQLHKDNLVKDGLVAVIFGITDGISSGAGKAKSQEVSATAKAEKSALDDILQGENQAAKNTATTGTVFDSIKGTQPVYPGSVIPKSFEMSLPNGQKVWVHGNATEHMVEYAASKAVTHTRSGQACQPRGT